MCISVVVAERESSGGVYFSCSSGISGRPHSNEWCLMYRLSRQVRDNNMAAASGYANREFLLIETL